MTQRIQLSQTELHDLMSGESGLPVDYLESLREIGWGELPADI